MANSLEEHYKKVVVPQLFKEGGYKNIMQVPRIMKITLNAGVGEAVVDKKIVANAQKELSTIAGQHAVITKARKSIAGFKIRVGMPIGCKVTLRRKRMYEFLERLIHIAIPRIRDFRGLDKRGFDGQGNYNIGIKEQIIFPEIQYDQVDAIRGLDIAITTSAKKNIDAFRLLKAMLFPFKEGK